MVFNYSESTHVQAVNAFVALMLTHLQTFSYRRLKDCKPEK